ncbi:MAG: hypothetical protein ACRD2T_09715 [Thermoanaerobaculia bacterium]
METDRTAREDRRRRYRSALRLWEGENPIKTIKLQALLLTNTLVLPAYLALERYLGDARAGWLAMAMLLADLVWLFSIGRTVAFQRLRKAQLEAIRGEDPADPFLSLHAPSEDRLPWWGRVPASRYLIGAPLLLALLWFALALRRWVGG